MTATTFARPPQMDSRVTQDRVLPPRASPWDAHPHFKLTDPEHIIQWIASPEGNFQFLSSAWTDITGQHSADGLGSGWLACVHPDDALAIKGEFATASLEGRGFRWRFRLRRHDGTDTSMLVEAQFMPGGFIGLFLPLAPCEQSEFEASLADHHLTDLLEHTRLAAVALDMNGRVRFANKPLLSLLGRTAEEVIERHFFDAFTPPGQSCPRWPPPAECEQLTDCGLDLEFEMEILDCGMKRHLLLWHAIVLPTSSGHARCLVLVGDDITTKRQTEERFLLTHKVFETTEMAMIITDARVRIVAANSSFTRLTGYSNAEAIGQNPSLLQSDRHDRPFYQRMWNSIRTTGHWHGEIWDRRKDGTVYPKFLSVSTIKDDKDKVSNYCGIFYDISERKSIEDKLDHLAHYDALTDLPNRTLLHERLDQAVTVAARSGTKVALLYLDLDHFKAVNDTVGHDVGDLLLQDVARRLRDCVRAYDTVARLGGDEFVVLLVDVQEVEGVNIVAEKLLKAIVAPFPLAGREFHVSTSIGISLYPDDHFKLDVLLKNADQAMYRAKAGGRAGFKFFGEIGSED